MSGEEGQAERKQTGDPAARSIERELSGNLPCVVCRYSLRGLSIRGVCPECGTAIRATILAVVDPRAAELAPIERPRVIAAGLLMWTVCGLGAALLCWLPHVPGVLAMLGLGETVWRGANAGGAAAVLVLLSGVGACALIRPHAGIPGRKRAMAAFGVVLYIPLAALLWWIVVGIDGGRPPEYFQQWRPDPERTRLRILFAVVLVVALLCLRPAARLLVARSLAIRTGRVDRQAILALVLAAGVSALGDAAALLSLTVHGTVSDVLRIGGLAMIIVGSSLLTLGLTGAVMDGWRIAWSIVAPPPSPAQIMEPPPAGGRGEEG